jgi:hypothetical protein
MRGNSFGKYKMVLYVMCSEWVGEQDGYVSKAFVSLASPFGLLEQGMSLHEWSSSIVQWIKKDGEVPYNTPCTCCTEKGASNKTPSMQIWASNTREEYVARKHKLHDSRNCHITEKYDWIQSSHISRFRIQNAL